MNSTLILLFIFIGSFVILINLVIAYLIAKCLFRLSDVLLSLESFLDRH